MAKIYQAPFVQNQNIGKVTLLTADTSLTVPITAGAVLFTAGTNGSKLDSIKVRALGTNVASVLRIFVNDGAGILATNFSLIDEIALPTSTASAIGSAQVADIKLFPLNYDNAGSGELPPYLSAGQKIYASLGTTVAAGYAITAFGSDF
jgi:hypothetical protein